MMFWSARQYSHCTCTCMSISVHSCVSFHTRVISGQLWFSFLSAYLTRAVRHWVKVSTPVLFFGIFLVHITLKYVNLNRMRFGPGYMSFESKQYVGQCRPELLFWTAGFEWLKHHKVGIFVEKVIRKGLQRARSLLSGIHSLQGNTIFHWVELTSTQFWAWLHVIWIKAICWPVPARVVVLNSWFWMTETPQSGNFRGKGNSQRLTKSKKFAFGNSQFTRQHNISLSGTNKYRRTTDKTVYIRPVITNQSLAWRLQSRFQVWLRKKNGKGALEQLTAISMDKESCL